MADHERSTALAEGPRTPVAPSAASSPPSPRPPRPSIQIPTEHSSPPASLNLPRPERPTDGSSIGASGSYHSVEPSFHSVLEAHSIAESHDDVHTGRSWARRVEQDAWMPLIITLDGGGIRGYSSLLILERLMEEVARCENRLEGVEGKFKAEDLKVCEYIDFMYGTSTGGLIATMLGRLRMKIPDAIEIYKEVGEKLFGKRKTKSKWLPLATKYDHVPLEESVKDIIRKHCPVHADGCDGLDWNPWDLDETGEPVTDEPYTPYSRDRICHTVCLTAVHNKSYTMAHLLRTYNHRYVGEVPLFVTRYNEGAERLRIWQTTRATSAAPFYFKSLVADIMDETSSTSSSFSGFTLRSRRRVRKEFKDGGIRENNPSVAAWSEFISQYGDGENVFPAMLLSIGTGKPAPDDRDGFAEVWPGPLGRITVIKKWAETFAVFKNMLIRYTQGESTHQEMARQARGQHSWYKRLNVDQGLGDMKLDNWERETRGDIPGGKTLRRMEVATKAYLDRDDKADGEYACPKVMIEQLAEKMVRTRREREKSREVDPLRWESFMGMRLAGQRNGSGNGVKRKDSEAVEVVEGQRTKAEAREIESLRENVRDGLRGGNGSV